MTDDRTTDSLRAAMRAHQAGETASATATLERLLEERGDDARVLWLLGRFRAASGDAAGATDAFHRATLVDPDSERVSIAYALSLPPENRAGEVARFLERHPRAVHHLLLLAESGLVPDAILELGKRWCVPPALAAHFAWREPLHPKASLALEGTVRALRSQFGPRVRSTTLEDDGVAWLAVASVEGEAWPTPAIRHVCAAVDALADVIEPGFVTVCPGLIRPDSLDHATCLRMGMPPWNGGIGIYDADRLVEIFATFAANYDLAEPPPFEAAD